MASRIARRILVTLALLALPLVAWSHEGHDAGMHHGHGIGADFSHPVFDIDHLLVMIAIAVVVGLVVKSRH
jgi:hydrogenase/urease accessory protein HupE